MKLALKILGVLVLLLALIIAAGIAVLLSGAAKPEHPVGFTRLSVVDPQDKPLDVGIWYPTDAEPGYQIIGLTVQRVKGDAPVVGHDLPLIVMSHGNGGLFASHADTALALASAGFVVAAMTHTGDNARDQSYVGTPRWLIDRPRHVHLVAEHLLGAWAARDRLDASRVGAFGFSAGAFTALVAAGGVPDLARVASHCAATPEFACMLWKPRSGEVVPTTAWVHEPRIKSLVIAAPGYGFAFEPNGLAGVTAPVQLWTGLDDRNVPEATNAAAVRRLLPVPPEYHAVPGATHFAFLGPCPSWLFPAICKDPDDFDRAAFHRDFNRAVVEFYRKRLGSQ